MNPWGNLTAEQRAVLAAQMRALAEGQFAAGAEAWDRDVYEVATERRLLDESRGHGYPA